jgi:putative hydrolase of the HAD superfamily
MKKIQIKALILDYGGVISRPQDPEIVNTMIRALGVEKTDFEAVYRENRAAYDSGHETATEYWLGVLKHLNIVPSRIDIATLIQQDVEAWTRIDDSMITCIKEIRSRIYNLSIISNMTEDTLVYIRARFKWLELFDERVFSCEFGINKPDPGIYEDCLKKIRLSPQQCLFVDDSAENIEGAAAMGMHTIHFKSFDTFLTSFNEKFSVVNGFDAAF